jgi:hypothetical protein
VGYATVAHRSLRLGQGPALTGIGGSTQLSTVRAALAFAEEGEVRHLYLLDLGVVAPSPAVMTLPSILGRDVLDRWRMVYDPTEGELSFEVRSADATLPHRP